MTIHSARGGSRRRWSNRSSCRRAPADLRSSAHSSLLIDRPAGAPGAARALAAGRPALCASLARWRQLAQRDHLPRGARPPAADATRARRAPRAPPSPASTLDARRRAPGPPSGEQGTLLDQGAQDRCAGSLLEARSRRCAALLRTLDAALRVHWLEPDSRIPERRAMLTPVPRAGHAASPCRGAARVAVAPGGAPLTVDGQAVAHVRESWLVEDRWWTDRAAAATPLGARQRRRPRPHRLPRPRRRRPVSPAMSAATPHVELHCHSGLLLPGRRLAARGLAAAALELGHHIARADRSRRRPRLSMEFAHAARAVGLRPIHGAELSLADGRHLTLLRWPASTGWRNLCRLLHDRPFRADARAPAGPDGARGDAGGGVRARARDWPA